MNYLSRKFILSIILFSLFVIPAFSQQSTFDKGVQLYNQKQYNEAIKLFEQAVKQKETKTDARIWNYLGLSYIQVSEFKDARKALEKAIKYAPQNADYRANLAYIYLLEGKFEVSLSQSKAAVELDSQNTNAYYFRGLSYLWKGEFEKAESDAEKIITINPDFTNAYILKADSFLYTYGNKWTDSESSRDNLDLLNQSINSLKECLEKCKNPEQSILQNKISELQTFYDYFKKEEKSTLYRY